MPRISGTEVAELVRKAHPEIRVLLMSGYIGHAALHRIRPEPLLRTPFNAGALQKALAHVMNAPAVA